MPFFGVEDGFPMHPKVVAAGNAAVGAWVRMGAHCVAHGTNGFISEKEAKIYATSGQLKRLLQCVVTDDGVGLFVEDQQNGVKGFRFHDWTQPDIETIRHRREVRAAAGRKGGIASAATRSARAGQVSKERVQASASPSASPFAQARAQANGEAGAQANRNPEDIGLGQERSSSVSSHRPVSTAYESERGSENSRPLDRMGRTAMSLNPETPAPPPPPWDSRIPTEALEIVRELLPAEFSQQIRSNCKREVGELLKGDAQRADVEEGLRRWLAKDENLHPGNIKYWHAKVVQERTQGPKLSRKDEKILRTLAMKSDQAALPAQPSLKEIEL